MQKYNVKTLFFPVILKHKKKVKRENLFVKEQLTLFHLKTSFLCKLQVPIRVCEKLLQQKYLIHFCQKFL